MYENNRTRGLVKLDWVPVPNKHDGDGYAVMMDRPDGAQLFGAWMAIIQLASKCPARGTLLRDSKIPHDSASISRQTRFPRDLIEAALEFFSCREMGWLDVSDYQDDESIPHPPDGLPHPPAAVPQVDAQKGREGKGIESPPPPTAPRMPQTVEEAVAWTGGIGIPAQFTKEVFLEHDGTAWTFAGKPITNWKSYVNSRWLNQKGRQEERAKNFSTAKKPTTYNPPTPKKVAEIPPWMADVEEIKRLLLSPIENRARLKQLGDALPLPAWSLLDGITEQNPLRAAMRDNRP